MGSWTLKVIFCFSGCCFSGLGLRISELFKCPKYLKRCSFTLRWLLDFENTSLEQNLRLKTLDCFLFILAIFYLLFGCFMTNFWLLLRKPGVNHCIWAINFLIQRWFRGVGSLLLKNCLVGFDDSDLNPLIHSPQIAEILSPDLHPVFPKCENTQNTQNSYSLTL